MELFSENHSNLLLSKEWLVKVDSSSSTPYLIKFHFSPGDLSCCIVITDTKSVWAEVLNSNQSARRWRQSNNIDFLGEVDAEAEDTWREQILELLSKTHTLGGIADTSFEVAESQFADRAFRLESESFKWRWEACFLGYKSSADIISKHLIFPLISVNHLAFSSAEPLGEIADTDLEKSIDKIGRTARRTVDTHVKNAISKPRVATSLRRMTAVFNFIPDLPKITSLAEKPDLPAEIPIPKTRSSMRGPIRLPSISPHPAFRSPSPELSAKLTSRKTPISERKPHQGENNHNRNKSRAEHGAADLQADSANVKPQSSTSHVHEDSATESEAEEQAAGFEKGKGKPNAAASSSSAAGMVMDIDGQRALLGLRDHTPPPSAGPGRQDVSPKAPADSDSDSSPIRPQKKRKPAKGSEDESEDSEEERKRRVAQLKSGAGSGAKRGTRQPIKRGGKRF